MSDNMTHFFTSQIDRGIPAPGDPVVVFLRPVQFPYAYAYGINPFISHGLNVPAGCREKGRYSTTKDHAGIAILDPVLIPERF